MSECEKIDCNKEYLYLFITSLFTSFLWVISEIIGSSSCKSNGVFEFIVNGFCVEVKYENNVDEIVVAGDDDSISSERDLLIKKTLPHYMGI